MAQNVAFPSCRPAFTIIELLVVIAIIALLVSILLPALASARRAGRLAICQSNMHQLGIAHHSYILDFKEFLASFNGLAEERGTSGYVISNVWPNMLHCNHQALSIIKSIDERAATLKDYNGIQGFDVPTILEQHSHLVLVEYLGGKVPAPCTACPEDAPRLSWQRDPLGMATSRYQLSKDSNRRNADWFPYGSTYQLMPAAWSGDAPNFNATHLVLSQGPYHDVYHYKGEAFGGRKISEVAVPSQKVAVADSQQRHHGHRDLYYAYPQAQVPLLFWDGAVSIRVTRAANKGWQRDKPRAGFEQFRYFPDETFESPVLGQFSTMQGGYYKWTRAGLGGIDFGGQEISTKDW